MSHQKIDRRRALREKIEKSKLTIPRLAARAGVNQQTIYNYLAGRSDMNLGTYDRIMSQFSI
ncbi:MAG TPA: helix-turn-helix transcriptional regulator [Planctomycetes bacterium]|nr:helix-turn-helix transcriptional regulator [Planctomycetota bacterium]